MYNLVSIINLSMGQAVFFECNLMCNLDTWSDSCPGVQSSEHDHHQLLRPLSEGRVHNGPGDNKTCGWVWLRLQQRPSSAHLQQHRLCLLSQPLPGAPQPLRGSGAKTRSSYHSQSKRTNSDLMQRMHVFTCCAICPVNISKTQKQFKFFNSNLQWGFIIS